MLGLVVADSWKFLFLLGRYDAILDSCFLRLTIRTAGILASAVLTIAGIDLPHLIFLGIGVSKPGDDLLYPVASHFIKYY